VKVSTALVQLQRLQANQGGRLRGGQSPTSPWQEVGPVKVEGAARVGGAWVIHSTTRPSSNPPAHAHPLDPQDMSIRLASPPATSPPLTPATQAISTDGVGRLTSLLSLLPHGPLKYSHTVPGRLWPSKRMGSVYGRSESRILAFVAVTSLRNPLLPTAHCKQRRLVWTALHMAAQRVQGRLKRGGPGQAEAIADCWIPLIPSQPSVIASQPSGRAR